MPKAEKRKRFNVGEPLLQIDKIQNEVSKYKLGLTGYSFHEIKNLKPVFAFDYLSLSGGELCFNSKDLSKEDYLGFLEGFGKYPTLRIKYFTIQRYIDFIKLILTIKKYQ
jgi:hypothetical protein